MKETPVVPMENGANALGDYVRRRVTPIFEAELAKVPSEARTDSMAITRILYRPNNFRRQTSVKGLSDSGLCDLKSHYPGLVGRRGLLFLVEGRVTLQVGRTKLTAIWNQSVNGKKEVFRFVGTPEQVGAGVLSKVEEIRVSLDAVLERFCVDNRLVHDIIIWERAEEWIKGESYLDSLPRDLIIYDTVFKKVYGEGGEFLVGKGGRPAVAVKNFIKNRALEDVSPEILRALEYIVAEVRGINPLARIKERVRVFPGDLLRPDVQALVSGLSDSEKCFLGDWLFATFGKEYGV